VLSLQDDTDRLRALLQLHVAPLWAAWFPERAEAELVRMGCVDVAHWPAAAPPSSVAPPTGAVTVVAHPSQAAAAVAAPPPPPPPPSAAATGAVPAASAMVDDALAAVRSALELINESLATTNPA
jgi:hypothetical protein